MKVSASAWCSAGVLMVSVLGGIAYSKKSVHRGEAIAVSVSNSHLTPRVETPVEDFEPRLLRLELESNASPSPAESALPVEATIMTPTMIGAFEKRVLASAGVSVLDSHVIDFAMTQPERRENWITAVEKWACGNCDGFALYFPRWSDDRQLLSRNTESTGMGIGLQFKATF